VTSAIPTIGAEIILRRPSMLGEGALWDARQARLYWIDILEHRVFCFDPLSGENQEFDVGEAVGTVVLTQDDKLLLALRSGFAVFDPESGRQKPIFDPRLSRQEGRFNDGKCDPLGRFWAGTIVDSDDARGNGALYCLDRDGTTTRKLAGVTCSNGLCWSADSQTFYYIDTPTYQVRAFDFDASTGHIETPRVAVELTRDEGLPDGMTIDSEGQLWIALFDGGKVLRIDPNTGQRTYQVIVAGGGNVTSCAFGGPRLDQLFITTARVGLSPEEQRTSPDAGSLFVATVPFLGVPSTRFGGTF
jgi:sugar lactone lactonase YvrE